jgi:hypothetical protein
MVVAAIMARNSRDTIGHAVRSVSWCDRIFILDDHSCDDTISAAMTAANCPIDIERSPFALPAFDAGELDVRNHLLQRVEDVAHPKAIVLLDADELMDASLAPFVREVVRERRSSISCSIFHLFDEKRYLRYRETLRNGIYQIDPHIRVIRPGMRYVELRPGQKGHPLMEAGPQPLHLHGPFHFHLKYLKALGLPNTSLEFLPRHPVASDLEDFLEPIAFSLPVNVTATFKSIGVHFQDDMPQLEVVESAGHAYRHISCLLITADVRSEAAILSRVLSSLRTCEWLRNLRVVRATSELGTFPDDCWTIMTPRQLEESGEKFDLVLQLSTNRLEAVSRISINGRVVRGLRTEIGGRLRPANICALGYARALEDGSEDALLPPLAGQAAELE